MTDTLHDKTEFAALDEKRHGEGLTPDEQSRWEELRALLPEEPGTGDLTASFPVASSFEGWGEAPSASEPAPEPLLPELATPEEATAVLWDRGPVEQPAEPLLDLVSGSPADLAAWPSDAPASFPPPDPEFEAVVVEVPEEEPIPEISADDVEEVVEPAPVATVSWVDEEPPAGEVFSLDALLVTPPPPRAESLAPPLPPPSPSPPPIPHPAAAAELPSTPEADPFAPSPSFVTGEHRIVLHTIEGQVLRGSIANADLADPELPMIQPNGAVARVPAGSVKAVFFMLAAGEQPPHAAGTRVRITFGDGRQVSGLAPDYSPASAGFFVLPVDTRTHTARVWVYRSAIRQISVG
jgi:hypothetical protein